MKNALSYLVQQLLKEHKLRIDFEELDFQIKSHPTYPSLHAITGVLDHFNIENLALDVPKNKDVLHQLPNTFLAQVDINSQKTFAIVTKKKGACQLVLDQKQKLSLSNAEFLEQFTGIILAVSKEETQTIKNASNAKPILVKGLALTSIIAIGILFIVSKPNLVETAFFLSSLLGIYIATTILKQEQGETTVLGNAFCSNQTERKNCDAVLRSKGATVFGIRLSDLTMMYFLGLTLSVFLLVITTRFVFPVETIAILAFPITIYSVYYQYMVLKKWCALCLSIVGVLWFQIVISVVYFEPILELSSILITVLSFSLISAVWLIESKIRNDNKLLKKSKLEYFKLKRNFELFNSQLKLSKSINTTINNTAEIILGNKTSDFTITFITNPLCGHCKAVHTLIENILDQHSQDIKIIVRFNVAVEDSEHNAVKITSRLLELYHENGMETCLSAMHDIYGDVLMEDWFKSWGFCLKPKQYIPILQDEYTWCTEHAISFTPEILINGKSYPSIFDRNDLIHFIEDLTEDFRNNIKLPVTQSV